MRRPVKNRNIARADLVHNSDKLGKFINYVMWSGKKNTARENVYDALDYIKTKTDKDGMEIFELAIKNTSPAIEVRSRRIGGANYQVPREVRPERRLQLSMRWILAAAYSDLRILCKVVLTVAVHFLTSSFFVDTAVSGCCAASLVFGKMPILSAHSWVP